MSERTSAFFERIWFLDCFGHLLSYAPSQDRFIRTPFQGTVTNAFVPLPYPVPSRAYGLSWWTLYGEQLPLEPLNLRRTRFGLVGLQKPGTNEYISINPRTDEIHFAGGMNDWEKFLPVTETILRGIAFATDPDMGIISSSSSKNEERLSFLSPAENKPGGASIAGECINIYKNLSQLAELGSLTLRKKKTVSFIGYDGAPIRDLTITCLSEVP